ncbi:MAG: AAA family ATPase [Gammaproteobacteria bacterium]
MYLPRFFALPESSFFLFGPRGVGKSTFLKNHLPEAKWFDLLKADLERQFQAFPERLWDYVSILPDGQTIIIDEIQKVPALLSVVHRLIEEKRNWRFILTGSSTRKLKRTGVDLLGGRALYCKLPPFFAHELQSRFDSTHALQFGMLPLILNEPDPALKLQAYISLYIKEEIQQEGLVRNLTDFSRFLEAITFSHGSILNVSNISRECAVQRKTVESYVSILEDLLLSFRLPVFTHRAQRALSSHPKFYFFDAGVFRSIRPVGPMDSPHEIEGAALEGLVAQHLQAWCDMTPGHRLYFWRTRAGNEVDFILYGPLGFWAIEVKHAKKVYSKDLSGLKAFQADYPHVTSVLLYCGGDRFFEHSIPCIPCFEFLKSIIPGKALDIPTA